MSDSGDPAQDQARESEQRNQALCDHQCYAFDSDVDTVWWMCAHKCGVEKTTATAGRHLNNAVAAVYANVGPSAVLADIRTAMQMLEIPEVTREWEHWNSRGESEWETWGSPT